MENNENRTHWGYIIVAVMIVVVIGIAFLYTKPESSDKFFGLDTPKGDQGADTRSSRF